MQIRVRQFGCGRRPRYGIGHMVEPDEGDARYWYRAAGRPFPGMGALVSEMGEFERAYTFELPI